MKKMTKTSERVHAYIYGVNLLNKKIESMNNAFINNISKR